MRKNLLQPEVKEEMLSRINKLTKDSKNQWGKMNVNQMLHHASFGIKMGYGEVRPESKGGWLKKQMMRFFIFKTDIPTPKEKAQTFPEIDTVALGINPPDFNLEKQQLFELVKNFPSKEMHPVSPLLGSMSKENWGRLHYTHLEHHLKQFGV